MLSLLLQSSSFETCSSRMRELGGRLGRSPVKYLVIDVLSNAAVLWRRYFELPVHLFAYDYLHKQTQSLEFRLIRIIENFELHERGLFST